MRFQGGTSTGRACGRRKRRRAAARRGASSSSIAVAGAGGAQLGLLGLGRLVVAMGIAMLQHVDAAGRRRGSAGQLRRHLGRDHGKRDRLRSPRPSSRSRAGLGATASSSRHQKVAVRPAPSDRARAASLCPGIRHLEHPGELARGLGRAVEIQRAGQGAAGAGEALRSTAVGEACGLDGAARPALSRPRSASRRARSGLLGLGALGKGQRPRRGRRRPGFP